MGQEEIPPPAGCGSVSETVIALGLCAQVHLPSTMTSSTAFVYIRIKTPPVSKHNLVGSWLGKYMISLYRENNIPSSRQIQALLGCTAGQAVCGQDFIPHGIRTVPRMRGSMW